jgi:uncharacterized damage-inducible protein DinB
MAFADAFLPEFDNEMKTTRSLLERVPFEKPEWKPHTKSMNLGVLASHVANLVGFGYQIASEDGLDMATRTMPGAYTSSAELLAGFDANVKQTRAAIQSLKEDKLMAPWTLSMGEMTIFSLPRAATLRVMMMNHIIHHRGQLSVYLRLNDVPLPSIYGPTADAPFGG